EPIVVAGTDTAGTSTTTPAPKITSVTAPASTTVPSVTVPPITIPGLPGISLPSTTVPGVLAPVTGVIDALTGLVPSPGTNGGHGGLVALPKANSNALVVSAAKSQSGHPLAVFGPQVSYFA